MVFIKQIMELGSGENSYFTESAHGISGEFDIDNIAGSMSFNLPYYINYPDSPNPQYNISKDGEALTTNDLKKFDTCNLYYAEFDFDPGDVEQQSTGVYVAGGVTLTRIFTGFIDTIKLSKSKSSINYEIGCLGTLGLSNYRSLTYKKSADTAENMILTLLQISGLQQGQFNVFDVESNIIPASDVVFYDVNASERPLIVDGGTDFKTVIDQIKEKYALIITQSGDGKVNILTPFYLVSAEGQERYVDAWNYDVRLGNLYEIDYGDLTTQYQGVIVLGQNGIHGEAVDPVAVEANGGALNFLTFENRNLISEEDCQKVARDKLLEMERNQFFTLKTKFNKDIKVADPITVFDNDRFTGNETLFVKKYNFTISKGDVSMQIQAFAHGATLIPEELALSASGVLDVDQLQIRNKAQEQGTWQDL